MIWLTSTKGSGNSSALVSLSADGPSGNGIWAGVTSDSPVVLDVEPLSLSEGLDVTAPPHAIATMARAVAATVSFVGFTGPSSSCRDLPHCQPVTLCEWL